MKKILAFALVAMVAGSAMAQGWWNEYIELSVNGGAAQQYQLGTGGSGIALDGADLSSSLFSLTLTDISINYWNAAQDRTGGNLFWQIYDGVEASPIVGPSSVAWTQTALGGNDYIGEWSGSQSLLGAASYNYSQTYYIQFWAENTGTSGSQWLNNGGDPENYQATFDYQPIPEPATMSLLGLGALAMVLRRKISK